ncbi:helix-hairpin-helix domain-containing protein [Flavihumibacter sp. ZG627]|uniref:ComEA family DNA-binding protein n=1 Tax=Flavihumibacter sp. ZG627 TaxID=1463156 RepID=UPI000693220B|nr:helix-hairpin-helix domain-containing protein [Flavihumibacter sp. ZG627]
MKKPEIKELIIAYLTFSARERIGVLVLVSLILILFIAPDFLPKPKTPISIDDSSVVALIDRWRVDSTSSFEYSSRSPRKKLSDLSTGVPIGDRENHTGKLFLFDPNTASHADWVALGVRDKTASTIIRYREKGGRFRKPEDISRIFGLSPSLAMRLQPFVRIKPLPVDQSNESAAIKTGKVWNNNNFPVPPSATLKVDINSADSLQWLALPGIGPKLTSRILNFRQRLGGFNSVHQIAEVYGLADSVFQIIKPLLVAGEGQIKQISINLAGKAELAEHPYIRQQLASTIVQYREAHGPFTQLEDLMRIHLISEKVFEKIRPYLKIP